MTILLASLLGKIGLYGNLLYGTSSISRRVKKLFRLGDADFCAILVLYKLDGFNPNKANIP